MSIFHRTHGMPSLRLPLQSVALAYTKHAREAAIGDKYADLTSILPRKVKIHHKHVVECEVSQEGGKPGKVLIRIPAGRLDLCLVLIPTESPWVWRVLTVWANVPEDCHSSLDEDNYERLNRPVELEYA